MLFMWVNMHDIFIFMCKCISIFIWMERQCGELACPVVSPLGKGPARGPCKELRPYLNHLGILLRALYVTDTWKLVLERMGG